MKRHSAVLESLAVATALSLFSLGYILRRRCLTHKSRKAGSHVPKTWSFMWIW